MMCRSIGFRARSVSARCFRMWNLQGKIAVFALHHDASLAGVGPVTLVQVVQRVASQILRRDEGWRPRLECLGRHVRKPRRRWDGASHDLERQFNVVIPVLSKNRCSSSEATV